MFEKMKELLNENRTQRSSQKGRELTSNCSQTAHWDVVGGSDNWQGMVMNSGDNFSSRRFREKNCLEWLLTDLLQPFRFWTYLDNNKCWNIPSLARRGSGLLPTEGRAFQHICQCLCRSSHCAICDNAHKFRNSTTWHIHQCLSLTQF